MQFQQTPRKQKVIPIVNALTAQLPDALVYKAKNLNLSKIKTSSNS